VPGKPESEPVVESAAESVEESVVFPVVDSVAVEPLSVLSSLYEDDTLKAVLFAAVQPVTVTARASTA